MQMKVVHDDAGREPSLYLDELYLDFSMISVNTNTLGENIAGNHQKHFSKVPHS